MATEIEIQELRDECGKPENQGKFIVSKSVAVADLESSDVGAMTYFAKYHGARGIKFKDVDISIKY